MINEMVSKMGITIRFVHRDAGKMLHELPASAMYHMCHAPYTKDEHIEDKMLDLYERLKWRKS